MQVIDITYDVSAGPDGLLPAIKDVCEQAQVRQTHSHPSALWQRNMSPVNHVACCTLYPSLWEGEAVYKILRQEGLKPTTSASVVQCPVVDRHPISVNNATVVSTRLCKLSSIS